MKHLIIVFAVATLATAAPASAQDARWTPWIGCWDLAVLTAQGARVCVERTADDAVTLRTAVQGQPVLEQTIVADGRDHAVSDTECRGTQRAEWSADGQRLFAHAELTCGEDKPRTVSGLALMAPDGTWLDIQSVRVDGRDSTRVRRYRRVVDGIASSTHFGAALTLEAIAEASHKVSPAVVEAAVVETRTRFGLISKDVIRLADAGVPERLIDLLIAVSYPKKFMVERTAPEEALLLPPLFLDDDPFYYTGYYYSPFAYGYGGYYYPWAFVPAYGDETGGGVAKPQPSGTGRVIDGVGYTRMTARQSPAQPGNVSSGGNSGTTSSTSSSSGGGSTVSSQGYSGGGGGGGDTGRTAVPR